MADFGKLNFSVSFNPTSAFPLDARSYFDTLAAATAAAATAEEVGSSNTTYYYGQVLSVVEDGQTKLYVITPDKTLQEVGTGGDAGDQMQAISQLQQQMATLNGDGAGSVKKTAEEQATAAINKWAQETSDNELIDTFKEVVDYVSQLGDAAELLSDITTLQSDVEGLQTDLDNKVDKNNDDRLMTQEEATKLEGITAGAEPNYINSTSTEFTVTQKKLSVNQIDQSKITGLDTALESTFAKTEDVESSITEATQALLGEENPEIKEEYQSKDPTIYDIAEKLSTLEKSAAKDITIATSDKAGLVKSSSEENTVTVDVEGKMTLNSLNVTKLTQTPGEQLILDCGGAADPE